jgi:hypothetical protein
MKRPHRRNLFSSLRLEHSVAAGAGQIFPPRAGQFFAVDVVREAPTALHVLEKALGHADITTTMRHYAHVLDDDVRQAKAEVQEALFGSAHPGKAAYAQRIVKVGLGIEPHMQLGKLAVRKSIRYNSSAKHNTEETCWASPSRHRRHAAPR